MSRFPQRWPRMRHRFLCTTRRSRNSQRTFHARRDTSLAHYAQTPMRVSSSTVRWAPAAQLLLYAVTSSPFTASFPHRPSSSSGPVVPLLRQIGGSLISYTNIISRSRQVRRCLIDCPGFRCLVSPVLRIDHLSAPRPLVTYHAHTHNDDVRAQPEYHTLRWKVM